MKTTNLWVNRSSLRTTCLEEQEVTLQPGDLLLEVERIGLSAGNISRAVAGDIAGYWQLFPAPAPWGIIPAWGCAKAVISFCENIKVGERFFGYLPMATHLVVRPKQVGDSGFVDGSRHRLGLPPGYNLYQTALTTNHHDDNVQSLLFPLFVTSFALEDFLAENNFFNARSVVISSASSKTSLGLAFELAKKHRGSVEIVGLTSSAHVKFVKKFSHYGKVVKYEDLETLDASVPSVFIDIAGNSLVLHRIHAHFKDHLMHSCKAGATHWEQLINPSKELPGPPPTLFFVPTYLMNRKQGWGSAGFTNQIMPDWESFVTDSRRWLKLVEVRGAGAMQRSYLEVIEGRSSPEQGLIILLGQ